MRVRRVPHDLVDQTVAGERMLFFKPWTLVDEARKVTLLYSLGLPIGRKRYPCDNKP